jgi:outer membrane protein assembly factor BamB
MGCYAVRVMLILVCIGCAGRGVPQWNQFHGNLSNTGYQPRLSGFAVAPAWESAAYQITSSSPVVGKDYERREIVYCGTTDGFLVAIYARDGREKWARSLGSQARIVSSPAVSSSGDVFVISGQQTGEDRISSTLHKVDPNGYLRWSFDFPENGFTTGSPKVWTSADATLVFAYVLVGGGSDLHGELVVVRDSGKSGELLDRKPLGACPWDQSKPAASEKTIESNLKAVWDSYSRLPVKKTYSESEIDQPDIFVDPSPAVFASRDKAIIAVVDNLCNLGAFEWDGSRLSVLWREIHRPMMHSSVAVLPNGLMVFGCDTGSVYAYDVETGVKVWQYEAGEPVFATPAAAAQRLLFVISRGHLQVLQISDGTLIHDNSQSRKIALIGQTFSSPAITADRVYVASQEMLSVSHDLKTRVHDTNFLGNAASSIAIGIDGAIYAVASDGTIWKYAGTR